MTDQKEDLIKEFVSASEKLITWWNELHAESELRRKSFFNKVALDKFVKKPPEESDTPSMAQLRIAYKKAKELGY